jgi:hypothetical protein
MSADAVQSNQKLFEVNKQALPSCQGEGAGFAGHA